MGLSITWVTPLSFDIFSFVFFLPCVCNLQAGTWSSFWTLKVPQQKGLKCYIQFGAVMASNGWLHVLSLLSLPCEWRQRSGGDFAWNTASVQDGCPLWQGWVEHLRRKKKEGELSSYLQNLSLLGDVPHWLVPMREQISLSHPSKSIGVSYKLLTSLAMYITHVKAHLSHPRSTTNGCKLRMTASVSILPSEQLSWTQEPACAPEALQVTYHTYMWMNMFWWASESRARESDLNGPMLPLHAFCGQVGRRVL